VKRDTPLSVEALERGGGTEFLDVKRVALARVDSRRFATKVAVEATVMEYAITVGVDAFFKDALWAAVSPILYVGGGGGEFYSMHR
jgi:hypothetical protein